MPEPDSNKTTRMSRTISLRPFRRWLFAACACWRSTPVARCRIVPRRTVRQVMATRRPARRTENKTPRTTRSQGFNRAMYTFNDKFDRAPY